MSTKKILFVIPDMQQGGAERVVSVMANYWAGQGNSVSILCFDDSPSYYTMDAGIHLYSLKSAKSSFWIAGFIVNNFLRTINYFRRVSGIKPDIIISFTDNANVYCILYNFLLRYKLIITQRTNPYFATLPKIISGLPRRIYKRATAIVVQTSQTLRIYEKLNVKLPAVTRVIYNPLPASSFMDAGNAARENIILAVGRLYNSHKHFDKLIAIFNAIDHKGWQLHIAGDGPDRENLQTLVSELGLEDKVYLLGGIKDLAPLYQRAKIFALTSQFEGFPNALCEAMANGCACISYNCETGPSEMITNDSNGLLIAPGNEEEFASALAALMKDEDRIRRFSGEARQIRYLLEENKIMQQWDSLIADVCNKKTQ